MCLCVSIQGWLIQNIPKKILYADAVLYGMQNYVRKEVTKVKTKSPGRTEITKGSDAQISTSPRLLNSS